MKLVIFLAACISALWMPHVSHANTDDSVTPDITIYHLEGRRSERIVWLMEELGLPYELVYVRGDLMASMAKIR